MYVVIFILAITFFIMFHEFGHFATARAFGMKTEKFFLGFGPTVWSFQRGDTEYGVKALPLGGFVKIAGMSPFEEFDEADRGKLFFEKSGWNDHTVGPKPRKNFSVFMPNALAVAK